jgi:hypothetical protein
MHIAFSCVESVYFRELLLYVAPSLEPYFVAAGSTIRRWILDEFDKARLRVKTELDQSQSRIHISFDLWTSPNQRAFVGVVGHYLNKDIQCQSTLIGLRRLRGSHSGENIAEAIIPILQDYEIANKLGCFMSDNAETNDVAIRLILSQLRPDIQNPGTRRVRCLGHILNLAAKAFLFGKDPDSFEVEANTANTLSQLQKVQELWRRKGALGKYHNTCAFIRATPQRRDAFTNCCVGLDEDKLNELMVILDNSTRWNSILLSLQRGLTLKQRIQLFTIQHKREIGPDCLDDEDWELINDIVIALAPFERLTIRMQGHARQGHHGSIWEALPALECLLQHIEKGKESLQAQGKARSPLFTCYNNAWLKLQKYYNLTDNSHQIYAAATLLNPTLRKTYFTEHWTEGETPNWIPIMLTNCRRVWEESYQDPLIQPTAAEQDDLDEFMYKSKPLPGDEFERYIEGVPVVLVQTKELDLVAWWAECKFPTLRQQAFDTLSIPAMSAECERVFSSVKKLISPERSSLGDDMIEASECMKIWWKQDII